MCCLVADAIRKSSLKAPNPRIGIQKNLFQGYHLGRVSFKKDSCRLLPLGQMCLIIAMTIEMMGGISKTITTSTMNRSINLLILYHRRIRLSSIEEVYIQKVEVYKLNIRTKKYFILP